MKNMALIFFLQTFSRNLMKTLKAFYKSNNKHFNGSKFRSIKTESQNNHLFRVNWYSHPGLWLSIPMIFSKSHKISSSSGASFLSETTRK